MINDDNKLIVKFKSWTFFFQGNACAEFNDGGKSIQRNIKRECKTCPPVYPSNESYKCRKRFFLKTGYTF